MTRATPRLHRQRLASSRRAVRVAALRRPRTDRVRAFTLVEMLVAVALVLLIMTLFAQIFQIAAGSLSTQQGIAENDQQARMISGLLRGDLDKRSMRVVIPFASGEDTRRPDARMDRRLGYFSYAENDPSVDTDDILQFTTLASLQYQSSDTAPYNGVANSGNTLSSTTRVSIASMTSPATFTASVNVTGVINVGDRIWVSGSQNSVNDGVYTVSNVSMSDVTVTRNIPNTSLNPSGTPPDALGQISIASEPEFDDGNPSNLLGASTAAEVCYFLRSGTLYRRMLLIRDAATLDDAQPKFTTGSRVITGNYGGRFWRDFDYSAFHYQGKVTTSSGTVGTGVLFHGSGPALDNGADGEVVILDETATPATTRPVSLGMPHWRFGHDRNTGRPREYLNLGADGFPTTTDDDTFIGRFLAQETASGNFLYPGQMPANNPYTRNLTAATGLPHVIDEFEDSIERRGDDIVMTNVLAFDVKIRDPFSGQFVDLGDDNDPNNVAFEPADRLNPQYSPDNRFRFDTWHPAAAVGGDGDPPFRPTSGSPAVALPITAVQITIVYQNRVGGRVRQVTIVQSLQDHANN